MDGNINFKYMIEKTCKIFIFSNKKLNDYSKALSYFERSRPSDHPHPPRVFHHNPKIRMNSYYILKLNFLSLTIPLDICWHTTKCHYPILT
jgi:hypothetical protein